MKDIFSAKKIYLIGIKGVGMTALAQILKNLNIEVVGSDTQEKFFTDEVLKESKIRYYEGFNKRNLEKELPVDLIISSVAYFSPTQKDADIKTQKDTDNNSGVNPRDNNPRNSADSEINLARKLNIPIITYPQALAKIFNQSFGIAICGSHGKSSTTAILGKIFKDAGLDPSCLVGSEVIEWHSNSLISKNFRKKIKFLIENEKHIKNLNWIKKNLRKLPIFIIEADEYREAFLNYHPKIIIITNIDYDHPDYFKTTQEYNNTYQKFLKNLKEPKLVFTFEKLKHPLNINYQKINFDPNLTLPFPLPGIHFQKNLQLLYHLAKKLGIPKNKFLNSIKNYSGIKRRFEIVKHSPIKDIYLIDDYAHHPKEILSFYYSLKEKFPDYTKYIIFQPHTFTRTHFLFNNFLKVFSQIQKDKKTNLIIFKTFPSAREKNIILKIKKLKTDKDLSQKLGIKLFNNQNYLIKFLKNNLDKKTIIATVGAGNIYKILEKITL